MKKPPFREMRKGILLAPMQFSLPFDTQDRALGRAGQSGDGVALGNQTKPNIAAVAGVEPFVIAHALGDNHIGLIKRMIEGVAGAVQQRG